MRRRRPFARGARDLVCVALLLAPAVLRWAWHEGWIPEPPLGPRAPARDEAAIALRIADAAATADLLRRTEIELRSLSTATRVVAGERATPRDRLGARWLATGAETIAVADPSPTRHVFWVSLRGVELPDDGGLPKDSAVVLGDALLGRLRGGPIGLPVGRVQTLLDPLFRARFRCGEVEGLLWGTGESTVDGRPLLELHHLSAQRRLEPGAAVVTAGDDGVYPPGLVVGEVADGVALGVDVERVVVALAAPERLASVVLLTDLSRRDLTFRARGGGR